MALSQVESPFNIPKPFKWDSTVEVFVSMCTDLFVHRASYDIWELKQKI